MKKQITVIILFILICFSSLQAQVTQEWVARYNGPASGDDFGKSIAVDGAGNIYVTGSSSQSGINNNFDYATAKFNSAGVELWVQRYNGPANGWDLVSSIAVDGSGNVYVTGRSVGIGTSEDYATIKYNSAGVEQWVQRYNGPENQSDIATSIAVDSQGNVYVTGGSGGTGTNYYDYATIKYNSAGDSLWVARYNGSTNGEDFANSLKIDASGNVYITGRSAGIGTIWDYSTIKYNSFGVEQWVKRYNDSANSYDQAISLATDFTGNVYVTGSSIGSVTGSDYATIKYNSSGIQQWVERYNGPGNIEDLPTSLAVDASGNVYVTGSIDGDGGFPGSSIYATIKYNSFGDSLWVAKYLGFGSNRFNAAYSIALDGSGNVYVTGESQGSGVYDDYATLKYDSSGVQKWVQRFTGSRNSVANSIGVDGSGNVYVTGGSYVNGENTNYATIKYSQITGIQHISSEITKEYLLSQNYPNPFNPTTKINYSLPNTQYTILKVFDVLGNEVTTLVNEKQNAGSYSVDFDGSNLSSGIYFYKLQTDNFSEVKKMTLLK